MWDLVGNPEDRFSHNEAQILLSVCNNCQASPSQVLFTPKLTWSSVPYHGFCRLLRSKDIWDKRGLTVEICCNHQLNATVNARLLLCATVKVLFQTWRRGHAEVQILNFTRTST